ncbi:MAG: hypothetical protein NVSMB55_25640 [Mycobacteriales bacterium]
MLQPVTVPASGIDRGWAFDDAAGEGVTVAIVDSGIDAAHPAIDRPVQGAALSWDPVDQQVLTAHGPHEDLYGHGTACAGLVLRAAPACALLSVRVLGDRLTGKGPVFEAGLRLALSSGARVVNLSLSSSSRDLYGAFHEVADDAYFAGVILVCAVNNLPTPSYPSQYAAVISVAANDAVDPFAIDCNPSPPAEFGAPGINVEVAWRGGGSIVTTGNSFAAPHVTGLVARLLSKHPYLSPSEVKAVLRAVSRNARVATH